MAELKISPFRGIDNIHGDPLEPGWSEDAVNVDVDEEGALSRRAGFTLLRAGVTSVFGSAVLGSLVGVLGGNLVQLAADGTPTVLGPVADTELWYAEVNDELLFGGINTLGVVRNGQAQQLGVEVPPAAWVSVSGGGTSTRRYGVIHTYVLETGEEGGASTAAFVDAADDSEVSLNGMPAPLGSGVGRLRTYMTPADGDVFYLVGESSVLNLGATVLNLGAINGKVCETRGKGPMRPGRYLAAWNGRLLTARGRTLYVSDAMRYGLVDLRTGFVDFQERITFVQPVVGGVYVGQPNGVVFLSGTGPADWRVVNTGAAAPIPGSSTSIDGTEFTLKSADSAQRYAVWLSERGYALGHPNGVVEEPQGKWLHVSVGQSGATAVHGRRLLSLVS